MLGGSDCLGEPRPPHPCVVFVGWWLTTSARQAQVDASSVLVPLDTVLGPKIGT